MQWSDVSFNPSRRTLRQFAALWVVFVGGFACWQYFRQDHPTAGLVLAALAAAVGLPGLVYPRAVRPVYVGAMLVAFPIGWTVSRVLLAVLFYGLFTPLAVLFRLMRRDLLVLRRPEGQDSYWVHKPVVTDMRRYTRAF